MKISLSLILLIGIAMEKTKSKPIFQSNSPSALNIDGNTMKALKTACDEFVSNGQDMRYFNITISKKTDNIKNDSDEIFIVTFMGKLAPGKRGLGTANRAPGSATYFISKERWKIIEEQGVK